jgi:hypothetical protein
MPTEEDIKKAVAAATGVVSPATGVASMAADSYGKKATDAAIVATAPKPPNEEIRLGEAALDSNEEGNKGAIGQMAILDMVGSDPRGPGPRPQGPVLRKGGLNWAEYGGAEGKDDFQTATQAAPLRTMGGVQEGADVAEEEGQALAAHYAKLAEDARGRMAAVENRRADHEALLMQKQQELEENTAKYTKDLADTGKFWRNPGNIISSLAMAFMPWTGAAPGTGIKMIDAAIQQDYAQRKQLADTHLGELKSNIAGYRSIMKDSEAGDLLALKESYEVATLDAKRIAAQFQGKKAKAAAETVIGELMGKSSMLGMELRRRIAKNPELMNKLIAEAYERSEGWQSTAGGPPAAPGVPVPGVQAPAAPGAPGMPASPGVAPVQSGGSWSQGQSLGKGAQVSFGQPDAGPGPGRVMPGDQLMKGATVSQDQPVGGPGHDSRFEKRFGTDLTKLLEDRSMGSTELAAAIQDHVWRAAEASVKNPADRRAVSEKVQEELNWTKRNGVPAIAAANKDTMQKVAGLAMFQQDIRNIEAAFGGDKGRINEFLGRLRSIDPKNYHTVDALIDRMGGKDDRAKAAMSRFAQAVAKNVNSYYRETSGGAVSNPEADRLLQVMSAKSTWDEIKNFQDSESRLAASQFHNNFKAGGNVLAGLLYKVDMGKRFPVLDSPGVRKGK